MKIALNRTRPIAATAPLISPSRKSRSPAARRRDAGGASIAVPGNVTQWPSSGHNFDASEEEGDLHRRVLGGIRAVHRIGLDILGELGADRAGRRLLRIGRAHHLAVA